MKIYNETKGRVVSDNVIYRKSIRELVFGLIPYRYKSGNFLNFLKPKTFRENDSMLFKVSRKDGIHTIFMSFSISVFLLNEEFNVVEKKLLNPFEVFIPTNDFRYFVEMVDTKFDEIEIGDVLKVQK
jgi:hypothetical protein